MILYLPSVWPLKSNAVRVYADALIRVGSRFAIAAIAMLAEREAHELAACFDASTPISRSADRGRVAIDASRSRRAPRGRERDRARAQRHRAERQRARAGGDRGVALVDGPTAVRADHQRARQGRRHRQRRTMVDVGRDRAELDRAIAVIRTRGRQPLRRGATTSWIAGDGAVPHCVAEAMRDAAPALRRRSQRARLDRGARRDDAAAIAATPAMVAVANHVVACDSLVEHRLASAIATLARGSATGSTSDGLAASREACSTRARHSTPRPSNTAADAARAGRSRSRVRRCGRPEGGWSAGVDVADVSRRACWSTLRPMTLRADAVPMVSIGDSFGADAGSCRGV